VKSIIAVEFTFMHLSDLHCIASYTFTVHSHQILLSEPMTLALEAPTLYHLSYRKAEHMAIA